MNPTFKAGIEVGVSVILCLVGGAAAVQGAKVWPDPSAFLYFGIGALIVWRWGDRLGEAWRRL